MKWAFSLTSLTSSSSSPSSSHSSLSSSSSFYPSTSPRLSSKIPCALRQGDGVYWRILLQHKSRSGWTNSVWYILFQEFSSHPRKSAFREISSSFYFSIVFPTISTVIKKSNEPRRSFPMFLGLLGAFCGWGRSKFLVRDVSQNSRNFPRVVCVCGAIGVCGECHSNELLNDVFLVWCSVLLEGTVFDGHASF